jgi:uncharacterized Rossmann fold enzyme
MIYNEWKPFYEKILRDLELNFKGDKNAAFLLESILKNKKILDIKTLKNLLKNTEVVVFGAGPSLEKSIDFNRKKIDKCVKIAADGATSALLKFDILPDIIVTDLDGDIDDQIKANSKGSIVIIHAHGDNTDALQNYVEKFQGKIIGSTQIDPCEFKNLYNFGGFTDGDRAVFLADHFKAKNIYLIGFDFNGEIGKYSFTESKNKNMKLKKIKWCETLIKTISIKNKNIEFL